MKTNILEKIKINIPVRLRNPVFWGQIIVGALVTMLAYYGLSGPDMTSWASLIKLFKDTFSNPYCLFLVASNVWSALNDPTTSGLTDSDRAMEYEKPLEK